MNQPPQLYVATYHYVRDLARTRFPRIKGMLLDDFREQVKALPGLFEMATVNSALEFLNGSYRPRRDLCLMTFDDGLKDHYANVTPILAEQGIQGIFFLITACLEERMVAPVHMNHFLMAALGFEVYRELFMEAILNLGFDDQMQVQTRLGASRRTYPLDAPEVADFKYFFNFRLSPDIRDRAVKILFEEHIGEESVFARDLYVSWAEAREMQRSGMAMGGHSHRHSPLATLRYGELAQDLTRCSDLMQQNLENQDVWPFSYPYGKADSFNKGVIEILRQLGYRFSLCTEPGINLPGADLFAIRRLDCNAIAGMARHAA